MQRTLGQSGPALNPLGLGCMGLSEFYGEAAPRGEAIALLHQAIELGVQHFDTAEMYGVGANEELLGTAFQDRREKVFIATKCGIERDRETGAFAGYNGSPARIRAAIEGSLKRLRTDHVDLYYLHRKSPQIPIEESVGAMAELVREGKVRQLGLSEVSAETLRKAHAVHPISALQSEYSLFARQIEGGVLDAVREIGASLVAYSPLGRGILTSSFVAEQKDDPKDFRRGDTQPRYSADNLPHNNQLAQVVRDIARERGVDASQVALAWVLAQGSDIHAIPGTTKPANLVRNLGAASLSLTPEELQRLEGLFAQVRGDRYAAPMLAVIEAS